MLVRDPTCPLVSSRKSALAVQVAPGRDAASTGLTGMRAREEAKHGLGTWAESLLEGFFLEQELAHTERAARHKATLTSKLVLWFLVQTQDRPCRIESTAGHGIQGAKQRDCCSLNWKHTYCQGASQVSRK